MRTALTIAFAFVAQAALAQTPTPTQITAAWGISFNVPKEHYSTDPTGTPVVDHYEALAVTQATNTTAASINIGKPTPDAAGEVLIKPLGLFAQLTPGTVYIVRVSAIGRNGVGVSEPSSPFVVLAPVVIPGNPFGVRVIP